MAAPSSLSSHSSPPPHLRRLSPLISSPLPHLRSPLLSLKSANSSEYMTYIREALELEDTIKNYERHNSIGWEYNSSIRPDRIGQLGSLFDTLEFFWKCILRKQVEKGLAILLGIMSVAILLAEATLLPSVDLSLFSILIKSVRTQEVLVQRMGNINNAVPFFGDEFNKIYPLIMVTYTLLVASNFFDRVFDFLGSWKRYIFKTEADDMDGFDPSGIIILQRERSWLEQGHKIGEQVVPLARNFNGIDIESGNNITERNGIELKTTSDLITEEVNGSMSKTLDEETRRYGSSREAISSKYAAIREQSGTLSKFKAQEKNEGSTYSALDGGNSNSSNSAGAPSSGLVSTWHTMKTGFQSFKANIGAKKFLPLRQQIQEDTVSRVSSNESLDDIFQRLKRPSLDPVIHNDDD